MAKLNQCQSEGTPLESMEETDEEGDDDEDEVGVLDEAAAEDMDGGRCEGGASASTQDAAKERTSSCGSCGGFKLRDSGRFRIQPTAEVRAIVRATSRSFGAASVDSRPSCAAAMGVGSDAGARAGTGGTEALIAEPPAAASPASSPPAASEEVEQGEVSRKDEGGVAGGTNPATSDHKCRPVAAGKCRSCSLDEAAMVISRGGDPQLEANPHPKLRGGAIR